MLLPAETDCGVNPSFGESSLPAALITLGSSSKFALQCPRWGAVPGTNTSLPVLEASPLVMWKVVLFSPTAVAHEHRLILSRTTYIGLGRVKSYWIPQHIHNFSDLLVESRYFSLLS